MVFANSTIFFFLIIDWYILIPAVNAQIFNPTAELPVLTGTPATEADPGIETQSVTNKKIFKVI